MDGEGLFNSTPTRRRFLAFGATGVTAAVIPLFDGVPALAQRAAIGSARTSDPVLDQVCREMAGLYNSAKTNGVLAQHVHGFASQLRIALAHVKATDLDRSVISGLESTLDTRGRDVLLDGEPDFGRIQARLRSFGMDVSEDARRVPLTRDQKSRCLNSLLATGISPHLAQPTAVLTRIEPKADTVLADHGWRGARVVPVQDGCMGWGLICLEMRGISYFVDWFMPELGAAIWACSYMCELLEWVICSGLLGG